MCVWGEGRGGGGGGWGGGATPHFFSRIVENEYIYIFLFFFQFLFLATKTERKTKKRDQHWSFIRILIKTIQALSQIRICIPPLHQPIFTRFFFCCCFECRIDNKDKKNCIFFHLFVFSKKLRSFRKKLKNIYFFRFFFWVFQCLILQKM